MLWGLGPRRTSASGVARSHTPGSAGESGQISKKKGPFGAFHEEPGRGTRMMVIDDERDEPIPRKKRNNDG